MPVCMCVGGWQEVSSVNAPFVPSKRLPDWASLELSPSAGESGAFGLWPHPRGLLPQVYPAFQNPTEYFSPLTLHTRFP